MFLNIFKKIKKRAKQYMYAPASAFGVMECKSVQGFSEFAFLPGDDLVEQPLAVTGAFAGIYGGKYRPSEFYGVTGISGGGECVLAFVE